MWPRRYFTARYWASRYWPQSQGDAPPVATYDVIDVSLCLTMPSMSLDLSYPTVTLTLES